MNLVTGVKRNDICAVRIVEWGERSASQTGGTLPLDCAGWRQRHQPVFEDNESEVILIASGSTYRVKPAEKATNAVDHTFQSVLEAHNLDPRESVIFEEFGCRGD